MPLPVAAMIAAGASIASTGANAYATGRMNKKSRKFAEKMYGRQREDAIADWQMQNEYNSPAAQMQRFREAGLNPNLIYGQMTDSPAVRSSEAAHWNPEAARFDLGNAVGAYQDAQMKEAQTDNLAAQKALIEAQTIAQGQSVAESAARTGKIIQDTEIGKETLRNAAAMSDSNLEALQAGVKKTLADTTFTLDQNERSRVMQKSNLDKQAEEILRIRQERGESQERIKLMEQQIENLKKEGILKKLDIDMRENGIMPSDPAWIRVLNRLFQGDIQGILSAPNAQVGATYANDIYFRIKKMLGIY